MTTFPHPIPASNAGDGSPLVLGDDNVVADLYVGGSAVRVLDWDADGELEVVVTAGNGNICSYKFIGSIADGTPIVDRGLQWGEVSRALHRNELDEGLVGTVVAAADFDGDGKTEVILAPRGYSLKPVTAISVENGPPATRDEGRPVTLKGRDGDAGFGRGATAAIDWNGDGVVDLVVLETEDGDMWAKSADGIVPEDQRDRYDKDGKWFSKFGTASLHLYRNTSSGGDIEFTYAGKVDVEIPRHTFHISEVNPDDPTAGILLLNYYGHINHVSILSTGDDPEWGEPAEIFTLHGEPFSRITSFQSSNRSLRCPGGRTIRHILLGTTPETLSGRGTTARTRPEGPSTTRPASSNSTIPTSTAGYFSVPTVGDWRDTGMQDILVGSVEGYIFWYKTLSTNPLRFAPPERVRYGTTEIRRLATPYPAERTVLGRLPKPLRRRHRRLQQPRSGRLERQRPPRSRSLRHGQPLRVVPELGHQDDARARSASAAPSHRRLAPHRPVAAAARHRSPDRRRPARHRHTRLGPRCRPLQASRQRRPVRPSFQGEKLRYEDGSTIKTHGIYTPAGGDGRGRTKFNLVDWDGDGLLDLLIGVGPQHGSPYRGSYILFAKNVGTKTQPVFKRPVILVFDADGNPLEFWRHGVHMAPVDWEDDGNLGLIAGADHGHVWYWRPEHFGSPASGDPTAQERPAGEEGFGPRED